MWRRRAARWPAWVAAPEQDHRRPTLESIPEGAAIKQRITDSLSTYEKYSAPQQARPTNTFFSKETTACRTQSVVYVQDQARRRARGLLIEPERLDEGGKTVALRPGIGDQLTTASSPRSPKPAPASDWNTWHVLDVATGKENCRTEFEVGEGSRTAFVDLKDNKGFFYKPLPEPSKDAKFQALNTNQKLYYHSSARRRATTKLIYERPR